MKKIHIILFGLLLHSALSVAEGIDAEQQAESRNRHFSNIEELVSLRAPGLALKYLQREQPQYSQEAPAEWLVWEQQHILLLKYMQRWADIDKRIGEHYSELSSLKVATADRNWFLTEQLRALVSMKDYSRALARSRELLWGAGDRVKSQTMAAWRRIIIQVYLSQNRTQDAQIAMRRYQQDYGELQDEDGVSWMQLQGELYLQLGQFNDAIRVLRQVESEDARALHLLALLKASAMAPQQVLEKATSRLSSESEEDHSQQLYQYVALVASQQLAQSESAIARLEVLLSQETITLSDALQKLGGIRVDADGLWELYVKYGNRYGNRKGLLKGNDEAWYVLSAEHEEKQPVVAKSLLAVLALQSRDANHRQQAMKQLARLIEDNQQALRLVSRLFTDSERVGEIKQVPAEVRYQLVDYNLSQGDIRAAARLMADLQQPPADQPQFDWNLRRARVLILSGSFQQGATVLSEMLKQQAPQEGQADKYLQVVFDLQAVEQHKIALQLFAQLQSLVDDPKLERELTFWRAESYAGLGLHDQAAYLFLRSAISPEKVYDPWYHTATFRAAESLMDAGLYEDARQRLLHLLKITVNAARKAVIRQRLQAIQLKTQHH